MPENTRTQKGRVSKAAATTTASRKATSRKSARGAVGTLPVADRVGIPRSGLSARGGSLVLALRTRLGLSQEEMARLMYVSPRTLQRLERGESPLSGGDAARYHELRNLVDELTELIGTNDLADWIKMPLPDLKDRSAFETLAAGDSGKIWRMIYYLESGTPG